METYIIISHINRKIYFTLEIDPTITWASC